MNAEELSLYRARVNAELRREVKLLRGDRDRLEALLADALVLACSLAEKAGYNTTPSALMELLAAERGFRLERPHYLDGAAA